jgi:hypothetical protein
VLKEDYCVEFCLDGLLRMDAKSRAERLEILMRAGVLAPNDARVRLGLPRIAGLDDPAPVISGITPAANLADADEGDPPYE